MAEYQGKHKIKKVPCIEPKNQNIETHKIPYAIGNPIYYDNLHPVWSFKRMSREKKWVFNNDIVRTSDNCIDSQCVLAKLASFETMTWGEIKRQTHDKANKSSNHFVDLENLCPDAQKRLRELNINENLFSLRINNKTRIYGVLESHVFEILWYDTNHEIYPIKK